MRKLGAWPDYSEDEIEAATSILRSGKVNYWTGQVGREFEREYAAYCHVEHAIALANGTVALDLALEALGIGPGDDVIVTPRSFMASASCVVRIGARPVFADVCLQSQNITPATVQDVLTPNTRAIIAVHHAGWPCDMDGLMKLATENDLAVIEDCAQAHGAMMGERPVGSIGHIGAFSFCQDKIITTGGEGGLMVTNDEELWSKAWSIKDHGKNYDTVYNRDHPPGFRWLHETIGTNWRMTEFQAGIGRAQLGKLPYWSRIRNQHAARLAAKLDEFPCVRVPKPPSDVVHAYYRLYGFLVPEHLAEGWDRNRICKEMNDRGVPAAWGGCSEIYKEKAFQTLGLGPKDSLPVAKELGDTSIAFLVHPTLTTADIEHVTSALGEVFSKASR